MKLQKSIRIFLSVVLIMVLTQCVPDRNPDKEIPFDRALASQHLIPIEDAKAFRKGFEAGKRELQAKLPANYLDSAFNLPDAEMFNRHAFAALLNVKGAKGIRIYLGRDEKGMVRMVLLPVDSAGADIATVLITNQRAMNVPGIQSVQAQPGAQAMESGQRCPPLCKSAL